jgi:hypothetical protein
MLKNLSLFLFLSLFLQGSNPFWSEGYARDLCSTHLEKQFIPQVRNPFGRPANDKDILTYGFESEFTFDRIDGIVTHYAPMETLLPRAKWDSLSTKERVAWLSANKKLVFDSYRTEGSLVLNTQDPILKEFLPQRPIMDSTGNVELIFKPVNSLEEFSNQVKYVNAAFGAGSMQGSLGLSHDAFFFRNIGLDPTISFNRNIGMFNFFHDYDVLEKLSNGYSRWVKDNTKQVAKSFDHEFLGPITEIKHKTLSNILKANTIGEKFEAKYMEKVAAYDSSFKYIGSTTYRPDIIPSKKIIILEARDAHSSMDILVKRLVRNTEAMRVDRVIFEPMSSFKAFDSVGDFEKLPSQIQKMLKSIYKAKIKPDVDPRWYQGDMLTSVETFRNFAYPMRDWKPQISFFDPQGKLELKKTIESAQDEYLSQLKSIEIKLSKNEITSKEADVLIQKEVAYFSKRSGLYTIYNSWYEKTFEQQISQYDELLNYKWD